MKSVMIDIETLGTRSDSAVISLGVALFDETGVLATDGWAIRPTDWIGRIDASTVAWWMEQSREARAFSATGAATALNVALGLHEFYAQHVPEETWANDPSFDVVILKHWWENVGNTYRHTMPRFPVHYRAERSFRTIMAEAKRLGIETDSAYAMTATAHNPVDDAANQARAVILVRQSLTAAAWDQR